MNPMPLDLASIPPQPAPAAAATHLGDLESEALTRFAMTFDGCAHFGERWKEILRARHEEWEEQGTLPRDVDALRGLLFLAFREEHLLMLDGPGATPAEPGMDQPGDITPERRAHEAFKHALLARVRELVADGATSAPGAGAERPAPVG